MDALRLPVIRVWLELEVEDPTLLPRYLFSPLRGVLGAQLKRLSCVARRYETCLDCPLSQHCAYGYIFETPRPEEADRLRLYPYLPHPFTFTPSYPAPASPRVVIGLTLVGRGIQYFPHFVLAFEAAGKRGLGEKRVPFRLAGIRDHRHRRPLYQGGQLAPPELYEEFPKRPCSHLRLVFHTPVTLRYHGQLVTPQTFAFHVLVRNLLRRLSSLSYFHAGQALDVDFKGLIAQAEEVRTVAQDLRLVTIRRYSARQKQVMPLRGLVGEVRFQGEITPFTPLLQAGELVHVGKNTSFGFGYYVCCYEKYEIKH